MLDGLMCKDYKFEDYAERIEIVRCKDCKWHEKEIFLKGDYCKIWHHTTSLDAFCSHGERREDETGRC